MKCRLSSLLLCLFLLLACVPTFSACNSTLAIETEQEQKELADERYYILNTATKKYHLTNCSYLPSAENSKRVLRTAKSAYMGYSPCQHCIL